MNTVELFGLNFWKEGLQKAISALEPIIWNGTDSAKVVVTLNVDNVVKVHKNGELLKQYRRADFVFPDGFPILLAAGLLGGRVRERVTGGDLFQSVCGILAERNGRVFILGGKPGSEKEVEQQLSEKYTGLRVVAYSPPFGFTEGSDEARKAVELLQECTGPAYAGVRPWRHIWWCVQPYRSSCNGSSLRRYYRRRGVSQAQSEASFYCAE